MVTNSATGWNDWLPWQPIFGPGGVSLGLSSQSARAHGSDNRKWVILTVMLRPSYSKWTEQGSNMCWATTITPTHQREARRHGTRAQDASRPAGHVSTVSIAPHRKLDVSHLRFGYWRAGLSAWLNFDTYFYFKFLVFFPWKKKK